MFFLQSVVYYLVLVYCLISFTSLAFPNSLSYNKQKFGTRKFRMKFKYAFRTCGNHLLSICQGCQVSRILREAHAFCFDLPLASALAIVLRKAIFSRISPAFKIWPECVDQNWVKAFKYGHLKHFRNGEMQNFLRQPNQGGLPIFLQLYDNNF